MIVRIAIEGQYGLDAGEAERLNQLDDGAVAACDADDEERFRRAFSALLDFIRSHGRPLDDDRLSGSDVIVPPPDVSLEEAQAQFSGEGLIPG